ncbi:MAG: glycosyltransferase family 4 protein [Chitinophagales bacterium]|nr:glycosyltransferase family 4 protein [Chitinophagales bacterium]MCZ2394251.1 glycosyltransferase family 4 protein [Chitinophagales bacterium]
MKIGVWTPDKYLNSVRVYYEHITSILTGKGVEFIPFGKSDPLPEQVDLYWDPTCTGGKNPNKRFIKRKFPLVATVHGASNFSMPHHYTYRGWKQQLKGYAINWKRKWYWNYFRDNIEGIITVSKFAKEEIVRELQIDSSKIQQIYHGLNQQLFFPIQNSRRDFLLHVSVFQPVKNITTLLAAYQQLDKQQRLPLTLIVPGYPNVINIDGVTLIAHALPQKEIAIYMQEARAFILPSYRESFGLPLIEAMACGTPVITSKGSACEEIVKDNGILCDPYQVATWSDAMAAISRNQPHWETLSKKSLERASEFSWEKCAQEHYIYFQKTLARV